jgi:hypothetical protein
LTNIFTTSIKRVNEIVNKSRNENYPNIIRETLSVLEELKSNNNENQSKKGVNAEVEINNKNKIIIRSNSKELQSNISIPLISIYKYKKLNTVNELRKSYIQKSEVKYKLISQDHSISPSPIKFLRDQKIRKAETIYESNNSIHKNIMNKLVNLPKLIIPKKIENVKINKVQDEPVKIISNSNNNNKTNNKLVKKIYYNQKTVESEDTRSTKYCFSPQLKQEENEKYILK